MDTEERKERDEVMVRGQKAQLSRQRRSGLKKAGGKGFVSFWGKTTKELFTTQRTN